jgi:hypothetical protein
VSTQLVEVYLGDPIDDRNERQVLSRLRADLERRGIPARIYANFIAGPQQRQIDLLISTPRRLVHVELKVLDPGLPVIAGINGPWKQQLPDGRLRSLDRNFYRQAHEATFAISDDMHRLARRREIPAPDGKFYASFWTTICVYPDVPAGSRLETYRHVDVVGYARLLDLLAADGPRPQWTDDHWAAFARHLQLYPEPAEAPAEVARRAQLNVLEDYRVRFAGTHRAGLHEFVPVVANAAGVPVDNPVEVLVEAARRQQMVVFTGPSGAGKSHAAQHAALAVADTGGVPVWVRCAEYQRGRFSVALARAVAPFTAEPCLPMLEQAANTGSPVVIILDGLNECAPEARTELLEQLGALRLRIPVAAVVTSTAPPPPHLGSAVVEMTADLPDEDARAALLASYGAGQLRGAEAFQTPFELAMAAECAEELRPGAGPAELLDAYIGRRCPAETTRAGLRRVALEMDVQLRRALTVSEVRTVLHRTIGSSDPDAGIDAVLQSPLLCRSQGRMSFSHELLARFLTAEQLVLGTSDIDALADALCDPRHADLPQFAVALEHDDVRRNELLLALTDADLLHSALRGAFGSTTAELVRAQVTAALADAMEATESAQLLREDGPDDAFEVQWRTAVPRSDVQQALLQVAGLCLSEGLFISEIAELLDITDRRCAAEMRRLRGDGHRMAITTVVRATYAFFTSSPEREADKLAASVVLTWCHLDALDRWANPSTTPRATAMWEATLTSPRWGRLTAALLLVNSRSPEDLALLPKLFAAAWKAGSYHLRLEALAVITQKSQDVDETTAADLREALDACDTENILLNSSLFDAMAAYDVIEPAHSAEDIRTQIAAVLAAPEDPDAWGAARGLISTMFENQAVLGPYAEVIFDLDDVSALRLHVMAARAQGPSFSHDFTMAQIVARLEHADDATRAVVATAATTVAWNSFIPQEAVAAHLTGLHGWSQLADRLPPSPATSGDISRRAWRAIDELLFGLLRPAAPTTEETDRLWAELLDLCAPAAVDVLGHLRRARGWAHDEETRLYDRLVDAYHVQVRQLLEWGLRHRREILGTFANGPADRSSHALLQELGRLGTAETAALLHEHALDPEIGPAVVEAIRDIEKRTQ